MIFLPHSRGLWIVTAVMALSLAMPGTRAADSFTAVKDIVTQRCGECHTGHSKKGGFSMNTRAALLEGSENGEVVTPGNVAESYFYEVIHTGDEDIRMPPKGDPLTEDEIAALKTWIADGLPWEDEFVFGNMAKAKIPYRPVSVPRSPADAGLANPIDRLLAVSLGANDTALAESIDDRRFIRRVYLDLTGLLPEADAVEAFVADESKDKRAMLVDQLLADRIAYADHWLTFWNDLLRNDYYGTGFIDNGRTQITDWLYQALLDNKPYDEFAYELISAAPGAEGYIKGITWRGVVNASQRPVIQAAQNVSQVFLGTNLKCASCHDSFIDGWSLEEAYSFAGVFSAEGSLELVECDKPTGNTAKLALLFPELGKVDAAAPLTERQAQAAEALTGPQNGLFARTVVNRLWKQFFGYGLVEPVDFMADPGWHPDLLEWLAQDLRDHDFDLKHTMRIICTSRAYQMPAAAVPAASAMKSADFEYRFEGPFVRRLTAEQLYDAIAHLTGAYPEPTARDKDPERKFRGAGGQFFAILKAQEAALANDVALRKAHQDAPVEVTLRASAIQENEFLRTLGRPNREQVVTSRDTLATTLQALEMTNGKTFDQMLRQGAQRWMTDHPSPSGLADNLYGEALGRPLTEAELQIAHDLLGESPSAEAVADFLWAVLMQPEFQLIY